MDPPESKLEKINRARMTLQLPESATHAQIKTNYTQLLKKWHPDKNRSHPKLAEEKTRGIIAAHKIIMQYCEHYQYSFSRQEVEKYLSDRERWFKQYGCDPIWAGENK